MAVEDWDCPICGWWWTITDSADGIEAFGAHSGRNKLALLDITNWAAAAEPPPGG